jgi:hypothetical protein
MTIAHDRAAGAPLFVEYKPGMRRRIAAAVDALIALLDQIDGDVDLEPDADDEPSLGSGSMHNQDCWAIGGDDDRELDEAERSGCGDLDGVMKRHGFGVQFAE